MSAPHRSLAARVAPGRRGVNLLVIASLILLVVGLFAPLITFQKFFIFSHTVSLASALAQLLDEGYVILFVLIAGFSVVVPLMKLALLARLGNAGSATGQWKRRQLHWLSQYGKWSMLDVFVVAVLIVTIKLGAIASVEVHVGLYAFSASVLLTSAATARVTTLTKRAGSRAR